MKNFHLYSFLTGLASGLVVLVIFAAGVHVFHPAPRGFAAGTNRNFQGGGAPNTARMAQRLGLSEADLQKEMDSGKTMQQIAQEHGVTFGGGRRTGSGTVFRDSGASLRVNSGGSGVHVPLQQ